MKFEITTEMTELTVEEDELGEKLAALHTLGEDWVVTAASEGHSLIEEIDEGRDEIDIVEGCVYRDTEANMQYGDGLVRVKEVTNSDARNWVITTNSQTTTVADANPSHPRDATVVIATYENGGSKSYAFPATRLEET